MTRQTAAALQGRWLVVTDLDGTLLDDDYDLDAAAAAIDAQTGQGRIVAVASSKTCDEMRDLARRCRVAPVLIFENGAGIAWPRGDRGAGGETYRLEIAGEGYAALRGRLRNLRRRRGYRFLGFGDLSAQEVAEHTGLSPEGARLARHRAASEPIMWLDERHRLMAFRAAVEACGYRLVQGGRFHHVMPCTDKARGLARVADALRRDGVRVRVAALGDADNDLGMLRAAEVAVVFPRRGGGYLSVPGPDGRDRALRAEAPGARCWQQTLDRALAAAPGTPAGKAAGGAAGTAAGTAAVARGRADGRSAEENPDE
jgi:mannosyl-3-phosphoglycerate phosphatase